MLSNIPESAQADHAKLFNQPDALPESPIADWNYDAGYNHGSWQASATCPSCESVNVTVMYDQIHKESFLECIECNHRSVSR